MYSNVLCHFSGIFSLFLVIRAQKMNLKIGRVRSSESFICFIVFIVDQKIAKPFTGRCRIWRTFLKFKIVTNVTFEMCHQMSHTLSSILRPSVRGSLTVWARYDCVGTYRRSGLIEFTNCCPFVCCCCICCC